MSYYSTLPWVDAVGPEPNERQKSDTRTNTTHPARSTMQQHRRRFPQHVLLLAMPALVLERPAAAQVVGRGPLSGTDLKAGGPAYNHTYTKHANKTVRVAAAPRVPQRRLGQSARVPPVTATGSRPCRAAPAATA